MGAVVVDASVVLAILDSDDSHHRSAVEAWRKSRAAGDRVILPASVLAEVLVGASRLGNGAVKTAEAFIDSLVDSVRDIDRQVARAAASYRARYPSLRLPDALVLAVGSILNADTILTADARWSRVDRRVRVIRIQPTSRLICGDSCRRSWPGDWKHSGPMARPSPKSGAMTLPSTPRRS